MHAVWIGPCLWVLLSPPKSPASEAAHLVELSQADERQNVFGENGVGIPMGLGRSG